MGRFFGIELKSGFFNTAFIVTKKKRKHNNTPKRKRFNRRQRLDSAKHWLSTFEGGNVAKAYRKHYGIDWVTAFIELDMLGIKLDPKYIEKVLESVRGQIEARTGKRLLKARDEEQTLADYQDENYAYIVGYTSGGVSYGVTWEEWEELESSEFDDPEIDDIDTISLE